MRPRTRRAAAAGAAVAATGLLLAGCGGGPAGPAQVSAAAGVSAPADDDGLHGTLMEPPRPRPQLTLPATTGEPFDLGDRPAGEVTVLFFGYTHCPDLCPTTMADLARAREELAPEVRDRVRVVFVTEDPARDTPALLREWLDRFDPAFTGLIGGNAATAAALTDLYLPGSARVAAPSTAVTHPHDEQGDGHGHGDYTVDHAGIVYAWGPDGRSVVYTGGTTPEQYAEDLTRLATAG